MNLILRDASIDDAEIILKWRNDVTTRKNSFSREIIALDDHLKWYQDKMTDKNCFMYVLMDSYKKIGQVRIDRINDIGKISYMIAPEKRGMGYGKKIIELLENRIPDDIKVLVGFVEDFNEPSKKCFICNHYTEFAGKGFVCYIKIL